MSNSITTLVTSCINLEKSLDHARHQNEPYKRAYEMAVARGRQLGYFSDVSSREVHEAYDTYQKALRHEENLEGKLKAAKIQIEKYLEPLEPKVVRVQVPLPTKLATFTASIRDGEVVIAELL